MQQTMQASSTLAVGQFTADYGWTQAYRLWLEVDTLGYLAAVAEDDPLEASYDAVRDKMRELSPILRDPYFDPAVDNQPNIRLFESDLYLVTLTRQQQELQLVQHIADYWAAIDSDYSLINRIITTGLLLLGLVMTVFENRRLKQAAWAVVLLLAIACTVQAVAIECRILPARPAAAMDRLAEGVGLHHQRRYDEAIAALTEALTLDPTYTEAYVRRGFSYRANYDTTEDPEQLAAATADFEAAVADGRSEVDVIGQLAELYYLQGKFADAVRVSHIGVDDTDEFIHTFDLARSYLASGDTASAATYYEQGIAEVVAMYEAATELQPLSASFWRYLDIGTLELDALLRCAQEQVCIGAPPAETLDAGVLAETGQKYAAELKSLAVNLELNGTAEIAPIEGTVQPLRFTADADDTQAEGVFLYGVRVIEGAFDFQNLPDDATIVVKVFYDDWEYPPLRHIGTLDTAPDGTYTFTLRPGTEAGEYSVQVFVNGTWVQQGRFEIVYQEDE
jgi:tetratricopeptide (TPR) repeat protein